jgi:hypothetical protein
LVDDPNELLRDAVARNSGVVMSLPSTGMLRHHKSRFLCERDGQILVESIPSERPLIQEVIASAKNVGVSFKSGASKVVFAAPLHELIDEHRINGDTVVQGLRMGWPTKIQAIQRRSNYRVRVGAEQELSARVWRIAAVAQLRDRPMATAEIGAQLIDLSTGGMGVKLSSTRNEPLRIDPADRLRVEITSDGKQMVLEASLRHPTSVPKDATTLRAGLQFNNLESDMEGRLSLATLTKIIGELQRAEVRNMRLGLMSN